MCTSQPANDPTASNSDVRHIKGRSLVLLSRAGARDRPRVFIYLTVTRVSLFALIELTGVIACLVIS
jgi:hypothetical protein